VVNRAAAGFFRIVPQTGYYVVPSMPRVGARRSDSNES
jgi:hypothetical protein